ncbi:von Willebrand factor A domain-containing protein 3A isoform X4 [Salvelinus fontinalis]|uniref:von Willebrand factor A domain-containing protein 3A isoform X4 n=1 Tax=Salvelinus fontinalis TaxID=8038 RepID=UPI002485F7F6|nr:von Willebrand factor A domain-containing protein 3A isoform X4 [Salvelinus fontinalis]
MEAASTSLRDDCPPWEDVSLSAPHRDDGLLVTHVNQTQDLLRSQGQAAEWKSSSDWLLTHSLYSSGLSLSTLLSHGTTKISAGEDGGLSRQLEITAAALIHFDFQLYQAIELYHGRIRWLNQGSMKVFGLVKGSRVGVIVDTSDVNCTKDRLPDLQRNLLSLIEEQLSCKRQLYLMSCGTETSSLWDGPRDVDTFRLQEACGWVDELGARGGCNLLQALKRGLGLGCTQLDSLVIVLGSSPDQTSDALFDYVGQNILGRALLIHVVSYCSISPLTIATVKRLAEVTRGRHHIFSASLGVVDSSTDVELLWTEIKAARELLGHTEALRQGRLGEMNVTVVGQQISTELDSFSLSPSLPRPPNHNVPLSIKPPGVPPSSSADWLRNHGLKAKRLGLYQVLSPNAYSLLEGFVPILNKTVSSTVHEKAMVQFEWHDGTVKNVHVDLPLIYHYQKQLMSAVAVLERRVQWLSSGSRQIWGTVCEQRVVIVVDMSMTIPGFSLHIQHSLRVLLEEQLANKHSFNIIAFGSAVRAWRERLALTSPENLQEAWQWVQGLQCSGSRNTMAALRLPLEGDLHGGGTPPLSPSPLLPPSPLLTQGLYLFTSGVPDQEIATVSSYVSECCSGRPLRLHICLLTGEETEAQTEAQTEGCPPPHHATREETEAQTEGCPPPHHATREETEAQTEGCPPPHHATREETAGALRELAQAGNGRFHWISETGILESDDISALIEEMERAATYWQKSAMLVDSLTQKSDCRCPGEDLSPGDKAPAQSPLAWRRRDRPLPPPRPTSLTLARLQMKEGRTNKHSSSQKALAWRPSSATSAIPPVVSPSVQPMTGWGPVETKAKQRKPSQVSQSVFYLEDGNLGVVFKSYPKPKSVRKSIPLVTLPKQEEICSTNRWLKRFSIKRQKLDIYKLVSGPDCTHHKKLVPSALKRVSAKYCSIFPSVHINGMVKHLQLTPGELKQYLTQTERLLLRYIQRLQWLLSGSRCVFGTVLEREVCVMLDVSGSMAPCLGELKTKLASLIWEQLHHNTVRFSLLAFSEGVKVWRLALQEPTEEACRDAVQWAYQLNTHGGTNTLEALQTGCGFGDSVGLYLLSDGKPDSSCSLVLKETERLTTGNHITIHTVSFNCTDSPANDFLKKLAHQTGGRYHRCHDNVDALSGLLESGLRDGDEPTLPALEGDDLRRLAQEIDKLRHFRKQAQVFREIILEKKNPEETTRINQTD